MSEILGDLRALAILPMPEETNAVIERTFGPFASSPTAVISFQLLGTLIATILAYLVNLFFIANEPAPPPTDIAPPITTTLAPTAAPIVGVFKACGLSTCELGIITKTTSGFAATMLEDCCNTCSIPSLCAVEDSNCQCFDACKPTSTANKVIGALNSECPPPAKKGPK